jgi:hypothetical protein
LGANNETVFTRSNKRKTKEKHKENLLEDFYIFLEKEVIFAFQERNIVKNKEPRKIFRPFFQQFQHKTSTVK